MINAHDKVNVQRLTNHIVDRVNDTLSVEDDEEGEHHAVTWDTDTYRQTLSMMLDSLIDKQAILKYYVENVYCDENGNPYGDISIIPMTTVEDMEIKVKISNKFL